MTEKAIIYHDKCNDGFCSMCVAMKKFGNPNITKLAANYHQEHEIFNAIEDLKGKDIVFVDFSFPPEIMEELLPHVNSVQVLDHHKTTLEKYNEFFIHTKNGFSIAKFQDKCEVILDMNRSGALVTWDYLFETPAPRMVKYISDADLYQFKDKDTIPFISRLSIEDYDEKEWTRLLEASNDEINTLIKEGGLLAKQFDNLCKTFVDNSRPIKLEVNGKIYFGDLSLCGGSSSIRSRVGELLYEKNGTFAALVSKWTPEEVSVSLRSSNKGNYNVREIAEFFGGGGHDSASAFKTTMEKWNEHMSYVTKNEKKLKP